MIQAGWQGRGLVEDGCRRYALHMRNPSLALNGPSKTLRDLTDEQLLQLGGLFNEIWRQQKRWIALPTTGSSEMLGQRLAMLVTLRMTLELPADRSTPALVHQEVRSRFGQRP